MVKRVWKVSTGDPCAVQRLQLETGINNGGGCGGEDGLGITQEHRQKQLWLMKNAQEQTGSFEL